MNTKGYFIEPPVLTRDFPSHVQWSAGNSILSPPECDALIARAEKAGFQPAAIGSNEKFRVDPAYRQTLTSMVEFAPDVDWLYRRVTERVAAANREYYGFDLSGLLEPFQLLKYVAAETEEQQPGHYDWHQDFGSGTMGRRKVSVVINLSDPADYDGCRLTLMSHNAQEMGYRGKGEGFMFPSWAPHMVSNITRGTRYALVAWVHGHPYR